MIVLVKVGDHLIYQHLFAKADRENIRPDELDGFKALAKTYDKVLNDTLIETMLKSRDFVEITDEKD